MNIETYLEQEPKARERSNKNRAIGNLMMKQYQFEIPKDKMADMVGEILSMDRKWRKCLEDRPELRGSDYNDKTILEQEKMLQLGYETNPFKKEIESINLFDPA